MGTLLKVLKYSFDLYLSVFLLQNFFFYSSCNFLIAQYFSNYNNIFVVFSFYQRFLESFSKHII